MITSCLKNRHFQKLFLPGIAFYAQKGLFPAFQIAPVRKKASELSNGVDRRLNLSYKATVLRGKDF